MKKKDNKKRAFLGIFFLLLLIVLWMVDLMKVWMIIMLLSVVTVPLWGRLYCGWVCPVATSLNIAKPLFYKEGNKTRSIKKAKWPKYLVLVISFVAFVVMNKLQFSVPIFILLIPISFVIVWFFGEAFWHYICPFGTIFGFMARFSRFRYRFLSQACSRCRLCEKNCTAACLTVDDRLAINWQECLYCGKCAEICPENNIKYGR